MAFMWAAWSNKTGCLLFPNEAAAILTRAWQERRGGAHQAFATDHALYRQLLRILKAGFAQVTRPRLRRRLTTKITTTFGQTRPRLTAKLEGIDVDAALAVERTATIGTSACRQAATRQRTRRFL